MRRRLLHFATLVSLLVFGATVALWVRSFCSPGLVASCGNPQTSWYGIFGYYSRTTWPWPRWAGFVDLVKREEFRSIVYRLGDPTWHYADDSTLHPVGELDDLQWHFLLDRRFPGIRVMKLQGARGAVEALPNPVYAVSGRQTNVVLWLGWPFLLSLPLTIWSICALGMRVRRRTRWREGHCPGCGYNLTGNVSGACPECGAAVPRKTEAATWRIPTTGVQ